MFDRLSLVLRPQPKPYGELVPVARDGAHWWRAGAGVLAFGLAVIISTIAAEPVGLFLEAGFAGADRLSSQARGEIVMTIELLGLGLFAIPLGAMLVARPIGPLFPFGRPRLDRVVIGLACLMLAIDSVIDLLLGGAGIDVPPWTSAPRAEDAFVFYVLATVIAAPIGEEILFRGLLQGAVRSSFGVTASLIWPTLLFAAVHYDGSVMTPLLLLPGSFCLALAREMTGDLTPPIIIHMIGNAVAVWLGG